MNTQPQTKIVWLVACCMDDEHEKIKNMIIKGWNKTRITRKILIDLQPITLEPTNVVTSMFNMTQQIEEQTQDDMDIDPTLLLSTITQCLMPSVCNKV